MTHAAVRHLSDILDEPALGALLVDEQGRPVIGDPPETLKLNVTVQGLPLQVRLTRAEGVTRCTIEARATRLPYTIESVARRQALQSAMRKIRTDRARASDNLRVDVARDQTILVGWDGIIAGPATINAILVELLLFLQAGRPQVAKLLTAA
jgi:hypothetical protein